MNDWNATSYDAKDNLLRTVRAEATAMLALVGAPDAWEAPTACDRWQVRDIVGHLIDVTESYFVGFDAARGGTPAADALGLRVMGDLLDRGAQSLRSLGQEEAVDRLRTDFDKLMEICSALGPDEWGGLTVPHKYMGPLPAFFYPVFQLMDYGVHSWDIRQGTSRAHGLAGDTADLLTVGVRVSGRNAGDYRVSVGPDGLTYALGDAGDVPAMIEFDAGSLVLTTFGRINAGTIRGDRKIADRFLNSFFRI
jgi:uncharacterized protein (TIGR03083 family)